MKSTQWLPQIRNICGRKNPQTTEKPGSNLILGPGVAGGMEANCLDWRPDPQRNQYGDPSKIQKSK